MEDIRPDYYKICSESGRKILRHWLTDGNLNTECRIIIREYGNDFDLGNAFKYLWRLGTKPGVDWRQDAVNSRFYLQEALHNDWHDLMEYSEHIEVALIKLEELLR